MELTNLARLPASSQAQAAVAELSTVTLGRDVMVDGRALPAGSAGTVVLAYVDGRAYEVEFSAPFHAVVTLVAADLRL